MLKLIAFAALFGVAVSPAFGAEPEVIDQDIIEGFRDTAMEVPGHPEASDEAKLALITGACTTFVNSDAMAEYAVRLASIRDGYLRGYVIRLFRDSNERGLRIGSMQLNRNICDTLIPETRQRADLQASRVLEPIPPATVRRSQ